MTKVFFDHLVQIDDVIEALDMYSIEEEERRELEILIDEIIHHHVLNLVLSRLPQDRHAEFISHITDRPHDISIWVYINQHAGNQIEEEVRSVTKKVKEDLKKEIHKAKKKP